MKDKVARYAAIRRELLRILTRSKFENTARNRREKSLRDTYTKARARQYQQRRTIKRTRHK